MKGEFETLSYPKEVRSKKEHKCNFCDQIIREGERYITSTHKYDGEVYDWKTHIACEKIAHRLNMYEKSDEGIVSDDFFKETIHMAHDELITECIPDEDAPKYGDIIRQLRHVKFGHKLSYVIRHFEKLDKKEVDNGA